MSSYAEPISHHESKPIISENKHANGFKGNHRQEKIYYPMKINQCTPKSTWDWFVLNFSRALADVTLVSGEILRVEPNLSCRIQGIGSMQQALLDFRKVSGI